MNFKQTGFLTMVFSVLGVVLYVTMFSSVLTAVDAILDYANLSTFTALSTGAAIIPTILLLSGVFAGGFGYYKGYQSLSKGGSDASGLVRMVMGVLTIILFLTLFSTILSAMYTLYGSANATHIAFTTVCQILPTILLLAGVFAGGATALSGYRARGKRRSLA